MSTVATDILPPAASSDAKSPVGVRAGTAIAIALGLAMATIQPGLAQWLNDEPKLIHNALLMNQQGSLATKGLLGSFNIAYGPAPTWFYQLLLTLTHRIEWIVTLHAVAFFGMTIGAGIWLAREAKLNLGFLAVLALCPAVCFYSRQMWDNSFNIPVSIALLACYARLLNRPAVWASGLLGVLSVLALSIHLSALPLIGAIGGHLLWRERAALKIAWLPGLVGALAMTVALIPYLRSQLPIAMGIAPSPVREQQGLLPGYPYEATNMGAFQSAAFAFTGTRALSADFSILPRFKTGALGAVQRLARAASWVLHAMFALGILVAMAQLVPSRKRSGIRTSPVPLVALMALLIQCAFFLSLRPIAAEHYFNGAFAIYPVLAWAAIERMPWGNIALALGAAGVGVSTVLSLLYLHQTSGSQLGYGPTLDEQRRLLADLQRHETTHFQTDVIHFSYFPQGPRTLHRLSGAPTRESDELPYVTSVAPENGKLVILPAARADGDVVRFDLAANVPWLQ